MKDKNKNKIRVGVKDIAAKAGVSRGTVDRVLNNRGEVKAETHSKVMAIVNELGYKPNVLAKSLASKKTTRIAFVIPQSNKNNYYWEKPKIGIKKATEELLNFNVEIIYERFDASSEDSFIKVLRRVCEENPDGVVLNPMFKSAALYFVDVFNKSNIPYVFIDINISSPGKIGYFGQDAERSGLVAARLMNMSIPKESRILIVKQSNKKVFSHHIELRVAGFLKYFKNQKIKNQRAINTIEIDLQNCDEPDGSLLNIYKSIGFFDGIFVPNSRVFKVADFIQTNGYKDVVVLGYDLVKPNIEHLEKGNITFLLSQKPEEQAYNAIMALFNNLITKKDVPKTTYSPIDIIVKENIDYYKQHK